MTNLTSFLRLFATTAGPSKRSARILSPATASIRWKALRQHRMEIKTESLACSITEFNYDPENDLIFDVWFLCYERLFNFDDAAKIRLLLRKLSTAYHKQYIDYILLYEPKKFSFVTTIDQLKQMFGRKISLFNQRYNCMNTTKSPQKDFVAYAAQVNKKYEEFQISQITADQFKCLIFVAFFC